MDIMYRVPSMENVRKVVLNKAFILGEGEAEIILKDEEK